MFLEAVLPLSTASAQTPGKISPQRPPSSLSSAIALQVVGVRRRPLGGPSRGLAAVGNSQILRRHLPGQASRNRKSSSTTLPLPPTESPSAPDRFSLRMRTAPDPIGRRRLGGRRTGPCTVQGKAKAKTQARDKGMARANKAKGRERTAAIARGINSLRRPFRDDC
jgi:hypothetical protein